MMIPRIPLTGNKALLPDTGDSPKSLMDIPNESLQEWKYDTFVDDGPGAWS